MTVKEVINQVEMLYGRQHHMYLKRLMNDALVDISSEAKHYKSTYSEALITDQRWYGIPDGIIEVQRVDVLNSDGKYELVPFLSNYDELLIGDDDEAHQDGDTDDDNATGSTGNTETRKGVNGKFAYYIQGNELALLYRNQSTGQYGTWSGNTVANGIRYTAIAIYSPLQTFEDDLFDINRIDSGLHALVLDYVKSRLEEDNGAMDKSSYFLQKYKNKVRKYPHRKSGKRGLKFPPL